MIIVLVTEGDGASRPDSAKVRLFEARFQAEEYCEAVSFCRSGHWKKAEIVREHDTVELTPPEE